MNPNSDYRHDIPLFRVTGLVRFADGQPAAGMKVAAFDRDLRNEQLLGQALTDRSGAFRIEYSEAEFLDRERGTADLVVKALAVDGTTLVVSTVVFNAPQETKIDLMIPLERQSPPTLFEKIESAIRPLLGHVRVEDLEENSEHQDLSFLTGETGIEKRQLARFALAHHLARLGIDREFWFALLGSSMFELVETMSVKHNLALVTQSLPNLDSRAVRKALSVSLARRDIPEGLGDRTDAWTKAFLEIAARLDLGSAESPTFVGMALDDAGVKNAEKRSRFARLLHEHGSLTPGLLATLEKDGSFEDAEIADLRTSYLLADLTRGDFSIVRTLKEEFKLRKPEQLRTLAKQSEPQWIDLIERKHKAGEITTPFGSGEVATNIRPPEAQIYARILERQFREAFPTAAFAGGLERTLVQKGPKGIRHAAAIGRIIDRHPEFDLLRTSIDEFLRTGIRAEFQALAKDETFRLELKAIQRVFKLIPTFEATDALLADGIHSAQMIYRLGESQFVRRYGQRDGFSAESARVAWNRAADTHAAVLTVIGDLAEFDSGVLPGLLKSSHPDLKTFPNWDNLFSSGDICHCEHCRSVLGPAAYFTDLLMFLRDRSSTKPKAGGGFHSVRDILFTRRPDLGYLELNCANALTTLPYVDVVNEVLERAVDQAGDNDLVLTGFTTVPLAAAARKTAVAGALAAALTDAVNAGKEKIPLTGDISVMQVDPANPDLWVVHGDEATYVLEKKGGVDFVAALAPNTKANSEELRAYPAYVNPKAYSILREARFPLALPFDLFAEEVRAAFRKRSLQRWDLMRTFRGAAAPTNPTDGEIAAEYFGISTDVSAAFDEKRLVLTADVTAAGQQDIWGENGNAGWLNTLKNVKTFLRKTGLEYEELLALLDLPFVNPTGEMFIQHLDPSCDLDKKEIQGFVPTKLDRLDRIHRFLRMWRKLAGWSLWELDLAIRCPGVGNGALDEAFLVNLFHFSRLRTRLGTKTTVAELCGLFDNLSVDTRFTGPHEKRADGLYQTLFLNRGLIQPLDSALDVAAVDVAGPTVEKISGHRPVILAALGVRETDLDLLARLTRASSGTAYITDDLTLGNLSFVWRHAWLAKHLKFRVDDWAIALKLLQQDVSSFADPKTALEFVERVDQLSAMGFTPDELDWLLAANRSARGALKEEDASRFLTALRTELKAIRTEFDPARYEFLDPPSDIERLTALLTSLLQQLKRDEAGAQLFIDTLRDEVRQERAVHGLPAGFTFPVAITGAPHNVKIRYEPVLQFRGVMNTAQRLILLSDPSLSAVTALPSYKQAIQALFEKPGSAGIGDLPPGFTFPAGITGTPNNIPIRYEPMMRFTGLMTLAQQTTLLTDPSLAAVTGIAAYQDVIAEFFRAPRLALKFLDPVFTAPLTHLPSAVDFKSIDDPALVLKISYDAEERALRVIGILTPDEKARLDGLSGDVDYRNAVNSLFTQPVVGVFAADQLWLVDSDLKVPLRDPSASPTDPTGEDLTNLQENLATAVKKGLAYLSKTLSEASVIRRASGQLGLTEGLTRRLLTVYAILPDPLLVHLTGAFATTSGVVDYATLKKTFDGWYWSTRVGSLWKAWKLTLLKFEQVLDLTVSSQLVDFAAVPLDALAAIAPIDRVLRTNRLFRVEERLPETGITLLDVLTKLNAGSYTAADFSDFASDVSLLNDTWSSADMKGIVGSLDVAYPAGYLLAETWERLVRAFSFVESLNAGAATVTTFAAATLTDVHAKTLKALLRSSFGNETWLLLSGEIQDALRELKRDALAAYLLAQPKPSDAPTGKWENHNDLYAYYLLDVEMGACQLTSRLVQASGSVQLFVQRCFLAIEPDVRVQADGDDGDSAWHWWQWMRKYRVWEANRKVFLWPENWIIPELKKDRSSFFRDLENELLQNEVNQYTVETAFANYLDKLQAVAHLQVAGLYQEDAGDDAVVHVFGRTTGAEPHNYYYRRYDYRQWTPWEKVDLDIQGNYLVPAVVNSRLFLFWPVFTEVSHEASNSSVRIPPAPGSSATTFSPDKTKKLLKLQIAVSDYRQGRWTPKKLSKDFDISVPFDIEIIQSRYRYFAVDSSDVDGRFYLRHYGGSVGTDGITVAADLQGAFELTGCRGVPEDTQYPVIFNDAIRPELESTGLATEFLQWVELTARSDAPDNDFTLQHRNFADMSTGWHKTAVLMQTPAIFHMISPSYLSYFDRLWLNGLNLQLPFEFAATCGSWSPFFYNDNRRTFLVLPASGARREDTISRTSAGIGLYYPELKRAFHQWEDYFTGQLQAWLKGIDVSTLKPDDHQKLVDFLRQQFPPERFPGVTPPPYTDDEIKRLLGQFFMRIFRFQLGGWALSLFQQRQFHFKNFYHPFVCDFAKLIYNPLEGIPALMRRKTQLKNSGFSFKRSYVPTAAVVDPTSEIQYPQEIVDFSPDGAFSQYNWELFFLAPLMIANALSTNQRFEEAREWYHFIFNPIGIESAAPGASVMSKYWITKPFFETMDPQYVQQRIENILRMLAGDTSVPGFSVQSKKALEDQVRDWRTNPFEPHRIASYRTVAYQKTVVMKYLDNLIAWGDSLFRQDSMESINEATQYYILAAELLGSRPKNIPPEVAPPMESFNELEQQLDAFANALVEVENLIPPFPGTGSGGTAGPPLPMFYFCIPNNEKLLSYWDTVADRLYKIRHCMNIEGVVRQLALFEPPIEPGLLVKAVAAGVDIGAALADLDAPLPLYRFGLLMQKANEVCGDVRALGAALMSALEKRDGEALSLLRQAHEIRLLDAVRMVREKQIDEAKENLAGVQRAKDVTVAKRDYYRAIEKVAAGEQLSLDKQAAAQSHQTKAQGINIGASLLGYVPNLTIGASGFGGTPHVTVQWGTSNIISALQAASGAESLLSSIAAHESTRAATLAGYDRRFSDWKLQEALAERELAQADRQIAAAELRLGIAERELTNHLTQTENAEATDLFMRSKYTNEDLYQWHVGQISRVYFQSYKLAYDLAKRAERCFRFDLGLQESSFISAGYWDSLKKGLLSGEQLQYDLRRMESLYLEQNRREFELTKHVSLLQLDPLALIRLRETGRCYFNLPEVLFDLDYPGHYFRRIKSVSLTLPCVTGPYTTIACTLRLLKNAVRVSTASGDNGYPRNTDEAGLPTDDSRFVETNSPVNGIATSGGQNDSGVFELSFRDERYLPFEGAGAISEWSLELFNDLAANNPDPATPDFGRPLRQFDYASIADAVLHVRYTAREDAGVFKNGAITHLRQYLSEGEKTRLLLALDLRRDFGTVWSRFLQPANPANGNVFELEMAPDLFPMRDAGKTLEIHEIYLLARCTDPGKYGVALTPPAPAGAMSMSLAASTLYGGLHVDHKSLPTVVEVVPTDPPPTWRIKMSRPGGGNLTQDPVRKVMEVEDMVLVVGYGWA